MDVSEKIAYLKGLVEGFGFDGSTKEGKVILTIMDILDDLAISVSDLEDGVDILTVRVDELEQEVSDITDEIWDTDDEDGDDFEGELYEVTCPSCSVVTCVDEDMLDEGEILCPGCGESLEFDLDGIVDGCDCGCGCDGDGKE
ncbi:MAG: hypothetical protein FWH02_07460 [Oscillospiraceae bacterium]|nr:hypothetical protein [Oscillospiraceae bacterium]